MPAMIVHTTQAAIIFKQKDHLQVTVATQNVGAKSQKATTKLILRTTNYFILMKSKSI